MNTKMAVLFVFAIFLAFTSAVPKPRVSNAAPMAGTYAGTTAAVTYRPAELTYNAPAVLTYPLSSSGQLFSSNYNGVSSSVVTATPVYLV